MKRRTLLAAVSTGTATVAGCTGKLDGSTNDTEGSGRPDGDENAEREYEECGTGELADEDEDVGRQYEECNHRILHYRILPEDVKTEVDTAFNQGHYESDGELLWEQVAGPGVEALERDGLHYAPQVNVDNGVHVLHFQEITPQYNSTKYLTVHSVPEAPLELSITVTDTEGIVLEETDLTIQERDSDQKVPVASEFGTYLVEVTVEDWGSVTEELTLGSSPEEMLLAIREGDKEDSSFSISIQTSADDGYAACPWEQSI
ncbi:hypothetical protein [Natrinema sp. HArc-T2]|uniref:hypothetical protein n=1 Tax=Natrinema sp. HArc-T2 TaxID=3242701 RepID=UPI00359D4DAA